MNTKIITLFFCLFLSACTVENSPVQLPSHSIQVADGQSILIRLNEGEMTVRGGEEGHMQVDGQAPFSDQFEYNVTIVGDQIQVVASYKGRWSPPRPVRLEVTAPNNVTLKIETEFAPIAVRNYVGNLEASSVSGDILIEDVSGIITARSNRGDITVRESSGDISVVGNYGALTVQNTSGEIALSTIMGNVLFEGLIQVDDTVRLETDHGAVSVRLSADSALGIQVRSTSGDVACMVPGVTSSTRTCDGTMNAGGGSLSIRTVSGPVTLQSIP